MTQTTLIDPEKLCTTADGRKVSNLRSNSDKPFSYYRPVTSETRDFERPSIIGDVDGYGEVAWWPNGERWAAWGLEGDGLNLVNAGLNQRGERGRAGLVTRQTYRLKLVAD